MLADNKELTIEALWDEMSKNPDRVYYTPKEKRPFKCVVRDNSFRVLRITENGEVPVKQVLYKSNLEKAIRCKPSCYTDISDRVRGPSYCYALIERYRAGIC